MNDLIKFCFFLILLLSACESIDPGPGNSMDDSFDCLEDDGPISLINDISSDVDFLIDCRWTVSGRVTIEPGTVIEFGQDASIKIEPGGALIAIGNEEEPIIMRGATDLPGFWKGIFIESNNPENILEYCIIENGGSSSFNGHDIKSNIRIANVGNPGKIIVRNCEFKKSGDYGFYVDEYALDDAILGFSNNHFALNVGYPIACPGHALSGLDEASTFDNNGIERIHVFESDRLSGIHTWQNSQLPYLIDHDIEVGDFSEGADLNIAAGAHLMFENDLGLHVNEFSSISARGIVGNEIIIEGNAPLKGYWKGILIESNNPINEFQHCTIQHGGSSSISNSREVRTNISVGSVTDKDATAKFTNVLFANSIDCGVYLYNEDNVSLIDCSYEDNLSAICIFQ